MGSVERPLRVALVEPFWGGSHRAFAEGWAAASRHRIEVFSLPARFWKWRMRGAALRFARDLAPRLGEFDLVFATDLLDLAHLRALLPGRVPAVLFFHENQAAYPARPGAEPAQRDLQYAFTNLASAAAADAVAFNSAFQRDAFFDALGELVRRMPDARPTDLLDAIHQKTRVLHLGVDLAHLPPRPEPDGGPPVVLWNHRWEHDKDPELFFRVLGRLAARGAAFRLAVVGESFGRVPPVFARARQSLGDRVVRWGYLPDRAAYAALLARCDVVVSTARQENFGISVVEAAAAGAHPLVPRALAYPEVLPGQLHDACLYDGEDDLTARLGRLLDGSERRLDPDGLRRAVARYGWDRRAPAFDGFVDEVFLKTGRLWGKL